MILFLTSNIGGVKKINGNIVPIKFFENNKFLENLKKHVKNNRKFVLIASNPDKYEKNDLFLQMDIEALKLSGLVFDEYLILDNRNKDNIDAILKNSDLILLCGGDTLTQNIFFNDIDLKKHLNNIDSVIVGISAGSINAAFDVYNVPECEEDLKKPLYLAGLGLTKINITPHFELNVFDDNDKKTQRKELLKESHNRKIIALVDGSYILKTDKDCKLYGESYKIENNKIIKICDNDKEIVLED